MFMENPLDKIGYSLVNPFFYVDSFILICILIKKSLHDPAQRVP